MKTADFDFDLPRKLIASRPSEKRDYSRLLVLHRDGTIEHKRFFEIIDYLEEGDMLLMNNTKVFPARVIGKKAGGRTVDMLLVRETAGRGTWEILCKGNVDGPVTVLDGINAEIETHFSGDQTGKKRYLRIPESAAAGMNDLLWKHGYMPLPPYIKRTPEDADKERYQTVYAERQGSIAAPTAGLHFTDMLINKIRDKGICVRFLTLHIGTGTFKPVSSDSLEDHRMDEEYFELNKSVMEELREVRRRGGRLISVGTTTTRALESQDIGDIPGHGDTETRRHGEEKTFAASPRPRVPASGRMPYGSCPDVISGVTDIFIYPGYRFKEVDCLLTNFHLPRSTPLMLVSALAGFDKISRAYREAVAMDYRFFSYGDAMLIL